MEYSFDHIADTAFWVAAFRAKESERTDAAFSDRLAGKLAGDRGAKMVDITPNADMMHFSIIVRTTAIDRLVEIAIANGVDTVINLGAGLDTRPYRLSLPVELNWIEVDFADIVNYKDAILADEQPVCKLRRIAADLSNDGERKALFATLGSQAKKALILTEGLVCYLENDAAAQLSKDLFIIPTFHYWVQEYLNGGYDSRYSKKRLKLMENTPLRFTIADPVKFFKNDGWKVSENIYMLDEGNRIHRTMPFSFPWNVFAWLFPKKIYEGVNKKFGIVMLERD